jgi:hypothetical protein
MPLPLVPIAVTSLIGGAWWAKSRRDKAGLDPTIVAQRQAIFDTAINKCHSGSKLRELAKVFRSQGLTAEADMLIKRAELNEASPEVKKARQAAFRKGMASKDKVGIRNLADAMQSMGAMGAAKKLREYADGLESSNVESTTVDEITEEGST